jgi:hypothetical protein
MWTAAAGAFGNEAVVNSSSEPSPPQSTRFFIGMVELDVEVAHS